MTMSLRTRPAAGTLAGRTAGAKSVAAIDRLLILDSVWSDAILALDPEDQAAIESQRDEFTELMGDLQLALAEAIAQIRELEMVLDSATDKEVDEAIGALGAENPQFAAVVERVFTQQIDEVGVRGAAIFACQYLINEEAETRYALQTKYDELMAGRPPNPGLPKSVKCALYLAGLGAAAAAVIASHGTLAIVGAVGGPSTSAILSWEQSGCVESWRTITGFRLGV
jgi:hypothetical protein